MSARGCSSDVTGTRSPLASLSRSSPAKLTCMVGCKQVPSNAFNAHVSAGQRHLLHQRWFLKGHNEQFLVDWLEAQAHLGGSKMMIHTTGDRSSADDQQTTLILADHCLQNPQGCKHDRSIAILLGENPDLPAGQMLGPTRCCF